MSDQSRKCHRQCEKHKCSCKKVKGSLKVCKNLKVGKDTKLCGDLTVKGESTFEGPINAEGGIVIDGCFDPVVQLNGSVTLEEPCFEVLCDIDINVSSLLMDKELKVIGVPIPELFVDQVKFEGECPPEEPPAPGTIQEGEIVLIDYMILENISIVGGYKPIYFQDSPVPEFFDGTVLALGCPDLYVPGAGTGGDDIAPPINTTITRMKLTIDPALVDPLTSLVSFNINSGYSTEPAYDFLFIKVNGTNVASFSGHPEDESQPYFTNTTSLIIQLTDEVIVEYNKDGGWHAGVDKCFFSVTDIKEGLIPDPPTSLSIIRDGEVIENFGSVFNLDSPQNQQTLGCDLSLKAGDQICLEADTVAYTKFNVDMGYLFQPNITTHFEVQTHKAPLITNEIRYNNRVPNLENDIGGWYESSAFINGTIFVEELKDGLKVTSKDVFSSGPFYMNSYWSGDFSNVWKKVGDNLYDAQIGVTYTYENGDLNMNYVNEPAQILNLEIGFPAKYRKIGNPNDELWKYDFDLKNYNEIFNSQMDYFDFVYNYYKNGFPTQFTDRSESVDPENLNPMELDMTQMKRCYGGFTRNEYDSLYKQIFTTGVTRKYNLNKLIYWGYPGNDLTDMQKEALAWVVNINRYGVLGVVPVVDNETGNNYPKIFPGETVIMNGSGTRLDDMELRVAMDGYHTGPKPGSDFTQTAETYNIQENWGLYSLRLPMIIDETNDTIWSDVGGEPGSLVFDHGTYYFNELLDIILESFFTRTDFILDVGNFFFSENAPENWLTLFTFSPVYGPGNLEYPSTFFGANGMDIEYIFEPFPDQIFTDQFVDIELTGGDSQYVGYKSYTPLNSVEVGLLLENLDTITIEATHGPITNEMPYDKLVACVNELSMARSTEDHSLIAPFTQKADQGLYEMISDFSVMVDKLNNIVIDNTVTYSAPYDQFSTDANIFAPDLYVTSVRATGTGHPGEYSEYYTAGAYRGLTQETNRGLGRMEWLVPQDRMYYTKETIVPTISADPLFQDVFNREVESPLVNYLLHPKWIIATTVGEPDAYPAYAAPAGAPAYGFAEFVSNSSEYATTFDGSDPIMNPKRVEGEWIVGTLIPDKVKEILNLEDGDEIPVIGYITHYWSSWSGAGNSSLLPWADTFSNSPSSLAGVMTVIKYFNDLGVQHIIADIRNTVGGGNSFWNQFRWAVGEYRRISDCVLEKIMPVDPNSVSVYTDSQNIEQFVIDNNLKPGVIDSRFVDPDYVASFAPDSVWNGEVTGSQANIIWLTNASTISATQVAYTNFKGCSLDKETFDGDFGKDTQFIGYGVYYRPFSTPGNYISYINWWTKGRKGSEIIQNGLLLGLDRFEVGLSGFIQGEVDDEQNYLPGATLLDLGQEFNELHRPNIKWDMNGTVAFQDIGFTKDTIHVDPLLDGEPYVCKRYDDVNFKEPTTFRDTVLEKCVMMATDPAVNTHFFQDDGYGYVNSNCP